jgi:hypothetical protein
MTEKPNPRLQFTAPLQHLRKILPLLAPVKSYRDRFVTKESFDLVRIWGGQFPKSVDTTHFSSEWLNEI